MEEFLVQVPLLLGVLGHRVLDPITTTSSAASGKLTFTYSVKDAKATGVVTDEGFVVLKGSTAMKGSQPSITPGWIAIKNELVATKKLVDKGAVLAFTDDVLFNSPSAAAAVIYGNNTNLSLIHF